MGAITTIGLDLAKNVFQVHGVDADGRVQVRIPTHSSRAFRLIPAGDSDGSQPPIPKHSSHP